MSEYLGRLFVKTRRCILHTARLTKNWLADNEIDILDWPPSSPADLNIIETVWHKIAQNLRNDPQHTIHKLRLKIQEIWNSFSAEECLRLDQQCL